MVADSSSSEDSTKRRHSHIRAQTRSSKDQMACQSLQTREKSAKLWLSFHEAFQSTDSAFKPFKVAFCCKSRRV